MNAEKVHKLNDVFGVSRTVPLNYVSRPNVDEKLIESLSRDEHIVIYGSSKQGKTSLRKHCLNESDYIVVQCTNKWLLGDVHTAILKQAGYNVALSTVISVNGKNKVTAMAGASIFGIGAKLKAEQELADSKQTTSKPLELDAEDVNDIIGALNEIKFDKFIVLEDFHYLPNQTQVDFSVALKAFHEKSPFCFIIVGVWLEENRLTVYNGDLTNRVIGINADKWSKNELQQVISTGEALLNVQFDKQFSEALLNGCFESVHIVQETCRKVCEIAKVFETAQKLTQVGKGLDVNKLIADVVNGQTGRYNSFLTQFAAGFQVTDLQMYKWLLYPVLIKDAKTLEAGLTWSEIQKIIKSKHPKGNDLNPGNLTQALQFVSALQVSKDVKPIVLDYDATNSRLNVVDRGFLIWLNNQDRVQLLTKLELPT